ncbi:MAG: His/Gly/Thr/Pro-type tRNA ligase C-terminal domain-containing protein, partial [Bacteroidota bacterium]
AESNAAFRLMQQLRSKGIRSELFHEQTKFDKQFKYADKKQIPYIVILGSEELAAGTCVVKDLRKGDQQTLVQSALQSFLFN